MDWQDELKDGLTKALAGLKTNEIPPEKAALELVFLDLNEEGSYQRWKELTGRALKRAKTFEIHCWSEERDWIETALSYGAVKESDWAYGTIIAGPVTPEFCRMLLSQPPVEEMKWEWKWTPFFNLNLDEILFSSHYGTEISCLPELLE